MKRPAQAPPSKTKYSSVMIVLEKEDILLHLSMFVVLPLPFISKMCAQQQGGSFRSSHIYALSRYQHCSMWVDCKFSDSSVFMKELVRRRGLALSHASAVLKDDREIVLGAVKQNGEALKYASTALQDDREIVLEAVKQNGNGLAVAFASTALKARRALEWK